MIRFSAVLCLLFAAAIAQASDPSPQAALALALALADQEQQQQAQQQQLPAVGVREGWTVQADQPVSSQPAKRAASDPPDYYGTARADALKRRKDLIVFVGHLPTIPLQGDYVTAVLESFEGDDSPRTIPSAYAAGQLWRTDPDLHKHATARKIGERLEELRSALTVRFQSQYQPQRQQPPTCFQQPPGRTSGGGNCPGGVCPTGPAALGSYFPGISYHGGYRAGPSVGRASASC